LRPGSAAVRDRGARNRPPALRETCRCIGLAQAWHPDSLTRLVIAGFPDAASGRMWSAAGVSVQVNAFSGESGE